MNIQVSVNSRPIVCTYMTTSDVINWWAVVKWLRLRLSIERSDVRGPPWSVLVAWGWDNITQPRKITKKKLHVVLKQGHNSGSPWWAVQLVCWSYLSWIKDLKLKLKLQSLPVSVFQLSDQQLQLPPLLLDGLVVQLIPTNRSRRGPVQQSTATTATGRWSVGEQTTTTRQSRVGFLKTRLTKNNNWKNNLYL